MDEAEIEDKVQELRSSMMKDIEKMQEEDAKKYVVTTDLLEMFIFRDTLITNNPKGFFTKCKQQQH